MNATATVSLTPEQDALQDWRRLVEFLERWNIADCVLGIDRRLHGQLPMVTLDSIAEIERAFAGTGRRMQVRAGFGGLLHASTEIEGVRVGACGKPDGRTEGEVTL